MYIYNVTIKINHTIEQEWLSWMKNIHLQDVMATGKFDSYTFSELMDHHDEEGKTFVVQYYTSAKNRYEDYIQNHAPLLREKGFALFGNQFIAFRSVLKVISSE